MIPRLRLFSIASASVICLLPALPAGCGGGDVEPVRPPRDARSEGPELDVAMLDDPVVKAFALEAAAFLELNQELTPLEARLADGSISEADTERWRELDAQRSLERTRLNTLMYAEEISTEQRAAMWWVLRGRTADGSGHDPDSTSEG